MKPISYVSEQPTDYAQGLSACKSIQELCAFLEGWKLLASDALAVAMSMRTEDWDGYSKGLRLERKGKFAGESWSDKYAAVLLPAVMFNVSIIASQFGAPFGCAYIRCKEEGLLTEENGIATWRKQA